MKGDEDGVREGITLECAFIEEEEEWVLVG